MAGFKTSNRLSPPLMWAFREAAAERDSREKPAERRAADGSRLATGRKNAVAINEKTLRAQVWRDLENLLNTVALESSLGEIRQLGHVRSSIVNYGLPDLVHRSIDELQGNDRAIERDIEAALAIFEPRLIAGTVTVKRDSAVDPVGLKLRYIVTADLFCRPVDIKLEFTADVEVDTGKFAVGRL